MPFPEDEGVAINPGQTTSIGLRRVMNRLLFVASLSLHQTVQETQVLSFVKLFKFILYTLTVDSRL